MDRSRPRTRWPAIQTHRRPSYYKKPYHQQCSHLHHVIPPRQSRSRSRERGTRRSSPDRRSQSRSKDRGTRRSSPDRGSLFKPKDRDTRRSPPPERRSESRASEHDVRRSSSAHAHLTNLHPQTARDPKSSSRSSSHDIADVEPDSDNHSEAPVPPSVHQDPHVTARHSTNKSSQALTTNPESEERKVTSCHLCSRQFISASGWYKHRRQVHGITTNRSGPPKLQPAQKSNTPTEPTMDISISDVAQPTKSSSKIPLGVVPCKPSSFKKHTSHQSADYCNQTTQTSLITVDLTDVIVREHMYDSHISTWLQAGFVPVPDQRQIHDLLIDHAREGARAMHAFMVTEMQAWVDHWRKT